MAEEVQHPWLTIVTVVKDAPGDFLRTVESVAAQDLCDVEYVVIDSSVDRNEVPACIGSFTNLNLSSLFNGGLLFLGVGCQRN